MKSNFVIVIALMIVIICYNLFNSTNCKIINIGDDSKLIYNKKLRQNEKRLRNWYPLGKDKFYLDHGKDYCKFFRLLGKLNMHVCVDSNNDIVGTCAMILRSITFPNNDSYENIWYLSDLKIEHKYRGNHIPHKMLTQNIIGKYLQSNKCYGITMDDKKNTRVVDICEKNSYLNMFKLKDSGKLYIYSIDYNLMKILQTVLSVHRGKIGYKSLYGIKDIILRSTKKPMKLLHVQWGKLGTYYGNNTFEEAQEGYTHMFCLYETDPLREMLYNFNITTDVTATIVQHNMDNINWSFILTSDI